MKRKSVESLNAFLCCILRQRGGTACRAVPQGRSGGRGAERTDAQAVSDRAGGWPRYRSGAFHSGLKGRIPSVGGRAKKQSRTVCPACFESCAGHLFSGAGRWRRCGCEADLRRLFPDLLCYLFRYLSRYIFSSRGHDGFGDESVASGFLGSAAVGVEGIGRLHDHGQFGRVGGESPSAPRCRP